MEHPKLRTKLLFWLILGLFSTFFAEVISGSTPFPFLPIQSAWGMLMVTPLYTLHILVFTYLVYRFGRPRFHTLFLAGALFGMYEAYATGVLWAGWSEPPPILLFEVGVIETLVLVLFWHPVFAFIIPVVLGEVALTTDRQSVHDVERFSTRKWLIVFALICGLFQSINMPSPVMALAVGGINIAILALFIFIWRKLGWNRFTMAQLLPSKTHFRWILAIMLAQYILLGAISADNYPNIAGHLAVLALYVLLILLFVKSLKKSRTLEITTTDEPIFSWRTFFVVASIFVGTSTILSALLGFAQPITAVVVLLSYAVLGILLFGIALRQVFRQS